MHKVRFGRKALPNRLCKVLYDKDSSLLIAIILVLYLTSVLLIKPLLWNGHTKMGNLKKLYLLRSAFISVWFTPSLFLSSHIALPMPSILALSFGLLFPSPSFSASFSIAVFVCASTLGFVICYIFYKRKLAKVANVI
jgi:hypothetical protein